MTNIFQMGFNHQPVVFCDVFFGGTMNLTNPHSPLSDLTSREANRIDGKMKSQMMVKATSATGGGEGWVVGLKHIF